VGPFEEEEEVTGITSEEVKVEGEDPATTGCRREALFLASLRFCVHYCIDRDTVQKKTALRAFFLS